MAHRIVTDISEDTRWALDMQCWNPIVEDYKRANELACSYQDKANRQELRIKELELENASLKADALRYRWLRDVCDDWEGIYWSISGEGLTWSDATDATIDSAMREDLTAP